MLFTYLYNELNVNSRDCKLVRGMRILEGICQRQMIGMVWRNVGGMWLHTRHCLDIEKKACMQAIP